VLLGTLLENTLGTWGTYWENSENLMRIHWEQQKSKHLTNFKEITKEGERKNIGLIMLEG
jgi:hypothetical protein